MRISIVTLALLAPFSAFAFPVSGDSATGPLETVQPRLNNLTPLSQSSLQVAFSEPMLEPGVKTPDNYAVSGAGAGTLVGTNPTSVTGSRPYTLTWASGAISAETVIVTATDLQDAVGNPIDPAHNSASWTGGAPPLPLPLYVWPLALALLGAGALVLARRRNCAGAVLLLVLAELIAPPAAFAQTTVTNVTFVQGPNETGGTQVDISYNLGGSDPCGITLSLSKNGGADGFIYPITHCAGDVGPGVMPGRKHIVWDIAADFANEDIPHARIRVTAFDGAILLPGSVPLVFVWVPSGSFQMGRYASEADSYANEDPQHVVTLSRGFWMGKYEITQQQWIAVRNTWPGAPSFVPTVADGLGDSYPACYISWDDTKDFVTTLNAYIINSGQGPLTVRLPSEAEWEYACRAGTATRFYFGDSLGCYVDCSDCEAGVLPGNRSEYMWYCGNESPPGSKAVGGKMPNAFGLFDMSGNVFEWCEDDYHDTYTGAPTDGSAWVDLPRAPARVLRGAGWYNYARNCRSADRSGSAPWHRYNILGFRLASVQ